jgi:hypothetical protein
MKGWQFVITAALVGAPCVTASAQSSTPNPQGAITPQPIGSDTGTAKHRSQGPRNAAKTKRLLPPIDTSKFRPAPNAGGGIGFRSGAITPGVGMTGQNAGSNNSNGRTATPAQGSSGSPNP